MFADAKEWWFTGRYRFVDPGGYRQPYWEAQYWLALNDGTSGYVWCDAQP